MTEELCWAEITALSLKLVEKLSSSATNEFYNEPVGERTDQPLARKRTRSPNWALPLGLRLTSVTGALWREALRGPLPYTDPAELRIYTLPGASVHRLTGEL